MLSENCTGPGMAVVGSLVNLWRAIKKGDNAGIHF